MNQIAETISGRIFGCAPSVATAAVIGWALAIAVILYVTGEIV